jgi:hypothetical protein
MARNSSRSAFFKQARIIEVFLQQSRGNGFGAACRGVGLQQAQLSPKGSPAIRDPSRRNSTLRSRLLTIAVTVRSTSSARVAVIVSIWRHRSDPRSHSCQSEPASKNFISRSRRYCGSPQCSTLAILFAPTDPKNISYPIIVVRDEGLVLCGDPNSSYNQGGKLSLAKRVGLRCGCWHSCPVAWSELRCSMAWPRKSNQSTSGAVSCVHTRS